MKLLIPILLVMFILFPVPGMAETDESSGTFVDEPAAEESTFVMDEDVTDTIPEEIEIPVDPTDNMPDDAGFPDEPEIPGSAAASGEGEGAAAETTDNTGSPEAPAGREAADAPSPARSPDMAANQTIEEMNNEYKELSLKRGLLDEEFQKLEEERKKLIDEKDGLTKKEDILEYNKRTEELNNRIQQYEDKWNGYNADVQAFNDRVKEDIEKRIEAVNQENLDTNYGSFSTQYEESLATDALESGIVIDEQAPLNEHREAIVKYKDQLTQEHQTLTAEKEAIEKDKKLVKTSEEVRALDKRTTDLNERIIKYSEKRDQFDLELKKLNERIEKGTSGSAAKTAE